MDWQFDNDWRPNSAVFPNTRFASTNLGTSMDVFLLKAVVILAGAVLIVPIFTRWGLGTILGYLTVGIIIGPSTFSLVKDPEVLLHFSELGVVLLLFVIGLELNPKKLLGLKKQILGIGLTQVLGTTGVIFLLLYNLGQLSPTAAIAIAMGLALSSTAIALQSLKNKNRMDTPAGEASFATLLMQDISVIPMLSILPLLSTTTSASLDLRSIGLSILAVVLIIFLLPRFMRPLFRYVASIRMRELFTALALLLVLGISFVMHEVGLSMALGSFLAGVVLADSEFRHQLEADIEPFKGLLLGLFFVSVGMSINLGLIMENPFKIVGLCLLLMTIKALVFYGICRFNKVTHLSSVFSAALLCQGGEFAFVFLQVAKQHQVLSPDLIQTTNSIVALSMAFTPFAIMLGEKLSYRANEGITGRAADNVGRRKEQVVICGYGRFGQMVGRVLIANKIEPIVLEHNAQQIALIRKFGLKAFYGDATQEELLEKCELAKVNLLVIALDQFESSRKIISYVKKTYPELTILVRCRNRPETFQALDMGVKHFYRETFETALECAKDALVVLGKTPSQAKGQVDKFKAHDLDMLARGHQVHQDENKLITLAQEGRLEFEKIMAEEESKS